MNLLYGGGDKIMGETICLSWCIPFGSCLVERTDVILTVHQLLCSIIVIAEQTNVNKNFRNFTNKL